MIVRRWWTGPISLLCCLLALTHAATMQQAKTSNCQCSLYKYNKFWVPEVRVFSMGIHRYINCSDFGLAANNCKRWCEGEMIAMKALVIKDASLLRSHQPLSSAECSAAPEDTTAFVQVCQSPTYSLASTLDGPSVCCDPSSQKPTWCVKNDAESDWDSQTLGNELQARKLDLQKDQNDISINEIQDAGRPEKIDILKTPTKAEPSLSWTKSALKFFGYDSFGDLVRNIDIFSIPGKVKSAVKTYKDELSMGRCYMEFTTFKVFTKQESPFEGLLRKKRETLTMDDVEEETVQLDPTKMEARKRAITNFMDKLSGYMGQSESTRQYANLLSTFLPVVSQMYTGESASVVPTLLNLVGPLLKQMQFSRPPQRQTEKIGVNSHPSPSQHRPSVPEQQSSPLASMAVNVFGSLIRNYLSSSPSSVNKVTEIPPPSLHNQRPPAQASPSLGDLSSSGLGGIASMLLKSFMGGSGPKVRRPAPAAPPVTPPPTPAPVKKPTQEELDKMEKSSFIDMVLEVIRPVFISLLGASPGDSGVKDIRRVSTLSTLGRVDDTLREEVDSPLFCFKKYAVNKAWSITESGVKSVVDTFSPEDQERMKRMLST